MAIIQTVDFFPPVVDDPYLFGQIAAANALSDVYAMGGTPTLALNLLMIPSCLPQDAVKSIMLGGADKVREAGAIIAGGHTIDDAVPKYGLCVSGFIHPNEVWSNATAKSGDVLILTKPLGSGIATTAAKADLITQEQLAPTIEAMAALNKYARDAACNVGVNACTDITGFGLLGHAREMADASGVTIQLFAEKPCLLPHVLKLAQDGIIPGGAYRNREYLEKFVKISANVPQHLQNILFDPQTSGGLLLSMPEASAKKLLPMLEEFTPYARIIGHVLPFNGISIDVV